MEGEMRAGEGKVYRMKRERGEMKTLGLCQNLLHRLKRVERNYFRVTLSSLNQLVKARVAPT